MRAIDVWADRLLDRDLTPQQCRAVAWLPPAGDHLLVACHSTVLVYHQATTTGSLATTLRAHKDAVYAVAANALGSLAASAGKDKTVIIWNVSRPDATTMTTGAGAGAAASLTAAVKYTHADSVLCLAFSAVSGVLCSGCTAEFGLWNPETKAVSKFKVPSKVTSCSWSSDGQHLALGLYNGQVLIRNKLGEEQVTIDRGTAPIWALQWNPAALANLRLGPSAGTAAARTSSPTAASGTRTSHAPTNGGRATKHLDSSSHGDGDDEDGVPSELLLVSDWNQSLALYRANGSVVGRARSTAAAPGSTYGSDGDPIAVAFFHHGEYALVAGSTGTIALWAVASTADSSSSSGSSVAATKNSAATASRQLVRISPPLIDFGTIVTGENSGGAPVAEPTAASAAPSLPPLPVWIWAMAMAPASPHLAYCTDQGTIAVVQVQFPTVHALHGRQYAYRAGLTDVVVQHFVTATSSDMSPSKSPRRSPSGVGNNTQMAAAMTGGCEPISCRIACRDHVRKVAVYHDLLAVQLPSRIVIHERVKYGGKSGGDGGDELVGMLVGMLTGSGVGGVGNNNNNKYSATSPSPPPGLEYRVKHKLNLTMEANLLVLTSHHVLVCMENTLNLYDFAGVKARSWTFDALVRYIKVLGGPEGREAVLVSLRDGWNLLVFLDHAFPVPLVRRAAAIRCADMNRARTRLAIVDDSETCAVYAIGISAVTGSGNGGAKSAAPTLGTAIGGMVGAAGPDTARHRDGNADDNAATAVVGAGMRAELLYQEPGATSVAWNTDHDDLVCISSRTMLMVKAGTYPALTMPHSGFVVGFMGAYVYSLAHYSMRVSAVPLASCLYQYMDRRDWANALAVSHLGASTDRDWKALGDAAMEDLELDLARVCYAKIGDYAALAHVAVLAAQLGSDGTGGGSGTGGISSTSAATATRRDLARADALAYRGKFDVAAELYAARGAPSRAVSMYVDLGLFEYALRCARAHGLPEDQVLKAKAASLSTRNDPESAAETYLQVGDIAQAVKLLIQAGCIERLAVVLQSVGDKMDGPTLHACAAFFRARDRQEHLAAVLTRLTDWKGLLALHVAAEDFSRAFAVAREHKLEPLVELPYAHYLLLQDNFSGALAGFARAGRLDVAMQLLRQVRDNAIAQGCYLEAARASFRLGAAHQQAAADRLRPPRPSTSSAAIESAFAAASALAIVQPPPPESDAAHHLSVAATCQTSANVLYAYHHVYAYLSDPFTPLAPHALLGIARYLAAHASEAAAAPTLASAAPWSLGLSRAVPYVALARLAHECGAPRLCIEAARMAAEHRAPPAWAAAVDNARLMAMAECQAALAALPPVSAAATRSPAKSSATATATAGSGGSLMDRLARIPLSPAEEDLATVCYQCAAPQPLLPSDLRCVACRAPIVHAFHSFAPIPVVELVVVADDESDGSNTGVGSVVPPELAILAASSGHHPKQSPADDPDHDPIHDLLTHDPAAATRGEGAVRVPKRLMSALAPTQLHLVTMAPLGSSSSPASATADGSAGKGGVKQPQALPSRLFYRLLADETLASCPGCARMYLADEYEYLCLVNSGCPLCRHDALGVTAMDMDAESSKIGRTGRTTATAGVR
ncbi:hypothetical protein BC828DRAFT_402829 [Blastocladiella britannica]|nr:hypothetical protein BC828DRAFT_402829 [Blastocladiella britannica]